MRLFDQTRAIFRLVLHNNEEGTISEEAKRAATAALAERERTKRAMDDLLTSLVRRRFEKELTSSQSINGTIRK